MKRKEREEGEEAEEGIIIIDDINESLNKMNYNLKELEGKMETDKSEEEEIFTEKMVELGTHSIMLMNKILSSLVKINGLNHNSKTQINFNDVEVNSDAVRTPNLAAFGLWSTIYQFNKVLINEDEDVDSNILDDSQLSSSEQDKETALTKDPFANFKDFYVSSVMNCFGDEINDLRTKDANNSDFGQEKIEVLLSCLENGASTLHHQNVQITGFQ